MSAHRGKAPHQVNMTFYFQFLTGIKVGRRDYETVLCLLAANNRIH